jgi:hypothetical protein
MYIHLWDEYDENAWMLYRSIRLKVTVSFILVKVMLYAQSCFGSDRSLVVFSFTCWVNVTSNYVVWCIGLWCRFSIVFFYILRLSVMSSFFRKSCGAVMQSGGVGQTYSRCTHMHIVINIMASYCNICKIYIEY